MTSSKFRGNIPHRATPQTCFPPPPPPLNPDIVPCLGTPFGPYATIQLDCVLARHVGGNETIDLPRTGNMALLTLAPSLRQWTARITDSTSLDITAGIRCFGDLYGNHGWQTMLTGRVTTPDGHELNVVTPWANAGTVFATEDSYQWHVHWDQPLNATALGPIWNLHAASGILTNRPDDSRSRPPAPAIPFIV